MKNSSKKFKIVWNICKGKTICQIGDDSDPTKYNHGGCGQKQPVYRATSLKMTANFKSYKDEDGSVVEARTVEMTPEKVLGILRAISDEECILMGLDPQFARPDWMVITVLPVPPICVRPSVSMDGVGQADDDLTHKLADILKTNIQLQRHESDGAPAHIISEFETLLQYHVATMMNNEISSIPQSMQKSGRPVLMH
jgi:DNA-directed RNA polymerase II subunit RPB1